MVIACVQKRKRRSDQPALQKHATRRLVQPALYVLHAFKLSGSNSGTAERRHPRKEEKTVGGQPFASLQCRARRCLAHKGTQAPRLQLNFVTKEVIEAECESIDCG